MSADLLYSETEQDLRAQRQNGLLSERGGRRDRGHGLRRRVPPTSPDCGSHWRRNSVWRDCWYPKNWAGQVRRRVRRRS